MKGPFESLWNMLLAGSLVAIALIGTGLVARLLVLLFCLGYGCNA